MSKSNDRFLEILKLMAYPKELLGENRFESSYASMKKALNGHPEQIKMGMEIWGWRRRKNE